MVGCDADLPTVKRKIVILDVRKSKTNPDTVSLKHHMTKGFLP